MPDSGHWIALAAVPDIGPVTFRRLLSVYAEPSSVFRASLGELAAMEGVGKKKANQIKEFAGWDDVEANLRSLARCNARVLTFRSPEYPALLRQVEDAPVLLYVKGSVQDEDRFAVALVGSRKYSSYGKLVAERLSSELSEAGFTVVSGMARGIDTVAHTSALTSGGRTIAVLGSGIDRAYPPENRGLMEKIADSGYVVTEFSCGTEPNRENFPRRNRLISGLSMGVVVVEAAAGSGALITASSALEQNREVFAVPGNITSANSAGTNDLIRTGAKLVRRTDDIIEELAPVLRGFVKKGKVKGEISDEEKRLCDILTGEPMHIDTVSRQLSLSPAQALATLLDLELKGVVRQADGKRFYLVS
ncbi:MAG: DNA-processing protein DprA [Nitrospirae bacterium]|nr:DNA-processing protein DprA [Nitrospirota bacterium]